MSISCRSPRTWRRTPSIATPSTSRWIVYRFLIAFLILLSLGARAAFAITISSFSPSNGNVGTSVTINGTGFSATAASNTVKFNGTVATVTSATTIKVIATVPSGATTGRITITVSGATATSSTDFTVKPQILNFGPTSGPIGTPVSINGEGFSPTAANNVVQFHGTTATVTAAAATQLTAVVPNGATTGTIKVTVGANSSTSTNSYTVTTSVTGLSPTSGVAGDSILISGVAFSSTAANNTVKFNGSVATVTQASTTQLHATVPDVAISGPISVTVGANTGTSAQNFTVNPTIGGFYPDSGFVGDTIYLWGTGFGDAATDGDTVTVNGVAATVIDSSEEFSDLDFILPVGATSGPVVLTRPTGESATSDLDFTVIPMPDIQSFSPTEGTVGTVVTIDGTNFSASADENVVTFNGVPAIVESATTTELHVTVPMGATTGSIGIGPSSSPFLTSTAFTVTAPRPASALYAVGLNSLYQSTLAVIDAGTLGTFDIVPFDDGCTEVTFLVANRQRSHVYSPSCNPVSLRVADTTSNSIIRRTAIDESGIVSILFAPNTSAVYVVGSKKVTVLDDTTGATTIVVDVASTLSNGLVVASALSQDGAKLYVRYHYYASGQGNLAATAVFDTATNSVVDTIDADVGILDPSGTRFYVGSDNNVTIWDIPSDQIASNIDLIDCPPPPYGCPLHELALSSDGHYLYDAPKTGMSMFVIDTTSEDVSEISIDGVPEFGPQDRFLALNAQGNRGYVRNVDLGATQVVDLVHHQTVTSVPALAGEVTGTDGVTAYLIDEGATVRGADMEAGSVSAASRTSLMALSGPLLYADLASADRLSVFSVNGEEPARDVYANTPFDVVIQAADANGPRSVDSLTSVSLALASGVLGALGGGAATCLIPAGGSVCTVRGLTIDTYQANARLTVSAVSGDVLTPANSAAFSVGGFPQPIINGFLPDRGPIGTTVTIAGEHFQPAPSLDVDVAFNGTSASVTSIADNQLVVAVPEGATTGPISVTVAGVQVTSTNTFIVMAAPAVAITEISPQYSYWTDPIHVAVTVTPVPPMTAAPTGTVTVRDVTNNTSCTIVLPSSNCDLIPPTTTEGFIGVVATYNGDTMYGTATSTPWDHTIAFNKATIEITSISPEPSVATSMALYQGAGVFFRLLPVTIPWQTNYLPSGTVVVSDGTTGCLAYMPEGLDVSFCKMDTPTPGLSTITAYYSGDSHYATTHSSAVTHATSSPGGVFSQPAGTEICGFDPSDNPAYQNPSTFVPIDQVAGAIPSLGVQQDIVGDGPLTVGITSPAAGAALSTPLVDVTGTFAGPKNTGIVVNGVVAYVVGSKFLAANVPLDAGDNDIFVEATTLPGATASASIHVFVAEASNPVAIESKNGVGAFGYAPGSIEFNYRVGTLPNGASLQSVALDFDGDGVWDYSGSLASAPSNFTYTRPDVYMATMKAHDNQGHDFFAYQDVAIRDLIAQRSIVCDVYGYLRSRLSAQDGPGAASAYDASVRDSYQALFGALATHMPDTAGQLGTIVNGFIDVNAAHLKVVRDNYNETRNGFPLQITQGSDGVWRISEM